jgi:hypothetical protein
MKKPTKKDPALELMSAMYQAQNEQFRAATNLAIGVMMKKHGITEMSIEREDLEKLVKGESVQVSKTVNGGLLYQFVTIKPGTVQ